MKIFVRDEPGRGIIFVFFVFVLSACGRSGDSGGEPAPLNLAPTVTTKSAAHTAVTALKVAQQGISIRPMPIPSWLGSEPIQTRFKATASEPGLMAQIHQEAQQFRTASPFPSSQVSNKVTEIDFLQACGSGSTNDGNTPADSTDDSFEISLDCNPDTNPGGGGRASGGFTAGPTKDANGDIIRQPDGSVEQYLFTYNNYTLTTFFVPHENQNGPITGDVTTQTTSRHGTILLDVAPGNCFRRTIFENTAGTFNVSGVHRQDNDGDGVFEIDQEFALSNLVISIAETELCAAGPVTITMNGTSSFTDHANPSKSTSSTFNNVVITVTPTSKIINTEEVFGHDYSHSGTITVSSLNACLKGAFSLNTETPFFIPNNRSCAILGKQLMTDTVTGQVSAVLATATGGIDVDEGNDGVIEQRFTDCKDAEVCAP